MIVFKSILKLSSLSYAILISLIISLLKNYSLE